MTFLFYLKVCVFDSVGIRVASRYLGVKGDALRVELDSFKAA
jgi:hypothetical protein